MVIEGKDLIAANCTLTAGILIFLTLTPELRTHKGVDKTAHFRPVTAAGALLAIFSASSIVAGLTQYIFFATIIFAIGLIALIIIITITGVMLKR